MAKLSINLLPPELEAEKRQKQRFSNTLRISIIFLIAVVGVAAVVLSLRLSQNVILTNINRDSDRAKSTLSSPEYSQKEGIVMTLKGHLDSIGSLLSQDTFGSYAFNLISGLTPQGVTLTNFNVDNKGIVKVTAEATDISLLDSFFNQLVSPDSNQKKISLINIDGLNRAKSSSYHAELSISLAGASAKVK